MVLNNWYNVVFQLWYIIYFLLSLSLMDMEHADALLFASDQICVCVWNNKNSNQFSCYLRMVVEKIHSLLEKKCICSK